MENLREIVLDTLMALERDQELSHQLMGNVLEKYDYLESQEKAFLKRVTEGTVERRIQLDYYLDAYSSVPVKKMKPLIRNLMRMSVYQLLFMDQVPDSAVCNEACKLAEKRKFHNLKGFVNGVLRKIARQKENLPLPDENKAPLEYLSVKYSMPVEVTKGFIEEYGKDLTEKILQGLLEIHPVSARVVRGAWKEETDLVKRIEQRGVTLRKNPCLDHMYLLENVEGMARLEDFQQGRITVQDASSALAVQMAGICPGDKVLDACAAPGGKTLLAAELTGESGRVLCGDVTEGKLQRIEENRSRLGLSNIEIRCWDARCMDHELEGWADVLLLDVPCSGLGVMGKKRDIKYHVTEEGLLELERLQKDILQGVWRCVRPGGILLYSTCTIRSRENRRMVDWILNHLPFEPLALDPLPQTVSEGIKLEKEMTSEKLSRKAEEACAQLLPGVLDCDGFFFARLRRRE